jgi:formate hydrogenlyase transcriptional activator
LALPQPVPAAISALASESLFQLSPDAILVTDSDGVIRAANSRSAELFGYTREEFLGKPIEDLISERFRTNHLSERENYSAHPRTRSMGPRRTCSA